MNKVGTSSILNPQFSMSSAINHIKANVRAIKAYTLAPLEAPIKINQNENPFGMPAAIKDEVLRRRHPKRVFVLIDLDRSFERGERVRLTPVTAYP